MEEQYQTIARRLLAEIKAERFEVGRALPTRTELAARFGVARATMDRAILQLIQRGVLHSSRGSGTFVTLPERNYHFALIGAECLELFSSIPEHPYRKIERYAFRQLESKTARAALSRFDGLIWLCPEEEQQAWMDTFSGRLPQIAVNRNLTDFDYVSTDHRGAIRQISSERLALAPDALPVFIRKKDTAGFVWGRREEGFVDACREAARFYEILHLPSDFDAALRELSGRFSTASLERPLLLVSGALENTGAVMAWARERQFEWQRHVYYSDFDNDFPENVWGVKVTSFLQDFGQLFSRAVKGLVEMMDGRATSVRELVMPRCVRGRT